MSNLTPMRYPGAKNKLLPAILDILSPLLITSPGFAEPFVGGGSVVLAVAQKYPNLPLYINDKDYWIASFWRVLSDKNDKAIKQLLALMEQKPTIDLFNFLRKDDIYKYKEDYMVQCAYRAIFFNRTCFSGILTSGPIGGQEQKSKWTVDCRYNYLRLKDQILKARELLIDRTIVFDEDAISFMNLIPNDTVIYLDPPYFVKGDMLYRQKMIDDDHNKLASYLSTKKNWLLSYDDCPEIRELYKDHKIDDVSVFYCINGKKENWKGKKELFIFKLKEENND